MKEKEIKSLVKPEGQEQTTFNAFKRFLKIIPELDNNQLAIGGFEIFHEARTRGGE